MMTRLSAFICACLMLVAASPAQAFAQSADEAPHNLIWSGLWAGANFDIGSAVNSLNPPRTNAPDDTTRAETNSSSQRTEPSNTSNRTGTSQTLANRLEGGTYVALGDSVAAGLGLSASSSATAEDVRCGRSPQAYAFIVAQRLKTEVNHLACSGATAGDLFTVQRSGSPNVGPQLDAAFAQGTPSLMTITAGANDADWAGFIKKCGVTNCDTEAFSALAKARLVILEAKLHNAFREIQNRSNGQPPRVVVTGYYNPLSQECTKIQSNINAAEIKWLSEQSDALNRTIRTAAASYPFVTYTSINFKGHDICSSDPWVQGLASPAAFHPTSEGQRAIARSVLRAIDQR